MKGARNCGEGGVVKSGDQDVADNFKKLVPCVGDRHN